MVNTIMKQIKIIDYKDKKRNKIRSTLVKIIIVFVVIAFIIYKIEIYSSHISQSLIKENRVIQNYEHNIKLSIDINLQDFFVIINEQYLFLFT